MSPCPCSVSRCSVECVGDPRFAVARRLVDGLRANSFTSLRSAATHRTAALTRKCEQIKREKRPLMALRRDAGRYRLAFSRPLPRSTGGVQELSFVPKGTRGVISYLKQG